MPKLAPLVTRHGHIPILVGAADRPKDRAGYSRGARIRVEGAVRRLHTERRASFARCEPPPGTSYSQSRRPALTSADGR
jgi:hypothetical protein